MAPRKNKTPTHPRKVARTGLKCHLGNPEACRPRGLGGLGFRAGKAGSRSKRNPEMSRSIRKPVPETLNLKPLM